MLYLTNQKLSALVMNSKSSPAKAGHKLGIKLSAQQTHGLKLWRDGMVKIAITAEEINKAYNVCTASSCMRGKEVGEFYSRINVSCVWADNARALVNHESRTFYKVYGADHASLEALLLLCGFKQTCYWLPYGIEHRLFTKKEKSVFVQRVASSLTQVWFEEKETFSYHRIQRWEIWNFDPENPFKTKQIVCNTGEKPPEELRTPYKRLISSTKDWGNVNYITVRQRRTKKFVDIVFEEKKSVVLEVDTSIYRPYVDGWTEPPKESYKEEEEEYSAPRFRAKVVKGAKQALRKGKKIKLAA